MKRLFFSLILLHAAAAQAQSPVSGTVVDARGRPLPYATILLPGGQGIVADSAGEFSVIRHSGEPVTVSSAGFRPAKLELPKTGSITVWLEPSEALDEVLVTVIQCRRRRREISICTTTVPADRLTANREDAGKAKEALQEMEIAAVYPNPTSGSLHFRGAAGLRSLLLLDAGGRLLRRWDEPFTGGAGTIQLTGFAAGTYLLRMHGGNGQARTERVVLIR